MSAPPARPPGIRFRFLLRPLAEIERWHWFGLTDGWYWVALDDVQLLRYAPSTAVTYRMAEPYVDDFVSGHSLAALEQLARIVAGVEVRGA